jgi:hypothetical protein
MSRADPTAGTCAGRSMTRMKKKPKRPDYIRDRKARVHEKVAGTEQTGGVSEKSTSPKRFNESQMKKVGVKIEDRSGWLSCMRCSTRWRPNLRPHGYLPRGYWKCPKGCNAPKAALSRAQQLAEALAAAKKTVKAPRIIAAYDLLEYVFSRGILPLSRQRAAVKGLVPWLIEQLPATARNERKELKAARDAYLTGGPSREDA